MLTMNFMENTIEKVCGDFSPPPMNLGVVWETSVGRVLKRRWNSLEPNTALNLLVQHLRTNVIVVPQTRVARGPGQPLPLGACALPAGLRVPRVCPQKGPGDPQLLFISDIDDHACTAEFTSASE